MNKIHSFIESSLDFMMASFLFLMGALICSNIVLRYFFNSGLPWAEELSRFLFVWVTFIGAIRAMKENKHLGFTSLIKRMPQNIKKVFYVISNMLMLGILGLLLDGAWTMTVLGMNSRASSTDVPMAFMFGVGLISFSWIALIIVYNTYRAFFVEGIIDDLIELQESEEEVLVAEMTKGDVK